MACAQPRTRISTLLRERLSARTRSMDFRGGWCLGYAGAVVDALKKGIKQAQNKRSVGGQASGADCRCLWGRPSTCGGLPGRPALDHWYFWALRRDLLPPVCLDG